MPQARREGEFVHMREAAFIVGPVPHSIHLAGVGPL